MCAGTAAAEGTAYPRAARAGGAERAALEVPIATCRQALATRGRGARGTRPGIPGTGQAWSCGSTLPLPPLQRAALGARGAAPAVRGQGRSAGGSARVCPGRDPCVARQDSRPAADECCADESPAADDSCPRLSAQTAGAACPLSGEQHCSPALPTGELRYSTLEK